MELEALGILERLESDGFEAYLVGGYVRDKVLGKPVKDIDIATSALPEDVMRLFDRTVPTGLKHGTVTVLRNGIPFEVTTFRKESDYEGFRRPAEVEFISDLQEDLKRRDFTMNAMAMDLTGRLLDPFGGQEDLARRVLRCVGNPHERFHEDALRMMRCIRFASTYSLDVEPDTWNALLERRDLLRHVAMERVKAELDRIMEGREPYRGWRLLAASGLLSRTKARLRWTYSEAAFLEELLPPELSVLDRLKEAAHRYMLLLVCGGVDAEEAKELLRQLTFSIKDLERIAKVVGLDRWLAAQDWRTPEGTVEGTPVRSVSDRWKLGAIRFGKASLRDWLTVREASSAVAPTTAEPGEEPYRSAMKELLENGTRWLEETPAADVKELALSGQELIKAMEKPAGPWVGLLLQRLLREAALSRVGNEKEALLALARSFGKEG